MPLSEYEQRVLEQMERALSSDDPRLANTLQSPRRHTALRYVLAGTAVLAGLLLLILGVALSTPWLGVIGFLGMFAGVVLALYSPRRKTGPVGVVGPDGKANPAPPAKGKSRKAKAKGPGLLNRLEQRWDRRREQDGK